VRTRFAPAPTGWLHLGHVLNAEYVWGSGAHVILRIEDHDRERCRPEYETGLVDDLAWLGYRYDLPLVRQSERDMIYREALEILRAQGLVYACDCTRRAIQERAADIHRPSSIAHRPSSIAHRPSSIVHRPSSIAPRPSPLGHRPSPLAHRTNCATTDTAAIAAWRWATASAGACAWIPVSSASPTASSDRRHRIRPRSAAT
jgi:hypothetical protein